MIWRHALIVGWTVILTGVVECPLTTIERWACAAAGMSPLQKPWWSSLSQRRGSACGAITIECRVALMVPEQGSRTTGWTLVRAAGAPAVLVAAAILARAAVTTSYDPLSETLSVLAGRGCGQGIRTAGFILRAVWQIATAVGLRVVRPSARVALVTAGCRGLVVAAFPVTVSVNEYAHTSQRSGPVWWPWRCCRF